MTWRLSRAARADVETIAERLAEYDPAAAIRLVDRLHARWDLLAEQPYSGVARGDIRSGLRMVVVRNYITLYRLESDAVVIVRVVHGKRDRSAI